MLHPLGKCSAVLALKDGGGSASRGDFTNCAALSVVNAERTKAAVKPAIERSNLWPDQTREALDMGFEFTTETCGSVLQKLFFLSGRQPSYTTKSDIFRVLAHEL